MPLYWAFTPNVLEASRKQSFLHCPKVTGLLVEYVSSRFRFQFVKTGKLIATVRTILNDKDSKGFEEKARQLNLGLEVYKAFKEHITGNHKLLQYNTEAANAIAKFILESVTANSKGTGKDLRSYFDAVPGQPVDTGDLYDSP